MTHRLQELKQQAGIDFNPDQEGLNLFAQLIIEQCVASFHQTRMAETSLEQHFRRAVGLEE
jgi:hypothetical protein